MKVSEALTIMNEKHVRRLPVVDNGGKMVGFISWRELFAKLPMENL